MPARQGPGARPEGLLGLAVSQPRRTAAFGRGFWGAHKNAAAGIAPGSAYLDKRLLPRRNASILASALATLPSLKWGFVCLMVLMIDALSPLASRLFGARYHTDA